MTAAPPPREQAPAEPAMPEGVGVSVLDPAGAARVPAVGAVAPGASAREARAAGRERQRRRAERLRAGIWGATAVLHLGLLGAFTIVTWTVSARPNLHYQVRTDPFPPPKPERRPEPKPRDPPPERTAEARPQPVERQVVRRAVRQTIRTLAPTPAQVRHVQTVEERVETVSLPAVDAGAGGDPDADAGTAGHGRAGRDAEPRPMAGCRPPDYPARARQLGITGTVELLVQLSSEGEVLDVRVARSSGSRVLDRAALDAVRGWRFHPRIRDGVAVPCEVRQPVGFRLR